MIEYSSRERHLLDALTEIAVIDCHEHLAPEAQRVAAQADLFTLFSHYTHGDLLKAGMTEPQYQSLFNRATPLDERWQLFEPFWKLIQWTSYARAARLAAEKFYGVAEINASTYGDLSEAVRRANVPGLYERVLGDACHIDAAMVERNARQSMDPGHPRFRPVATIGEIINPMSAEALAAPPFNPGANVRTLDEYLDAMRAYLLRVRAEGVRAVKLWASPYRMPDRQAALAGFRDLQEGRLPPPGAPRPLNDYVLDRTLACAGDLDLVVSVHTGYWGDFRGLDPLHMIPRIETHPNVRFDIYHLGFPWVRETLMLGKGFANVWVNFCWTHVISQSCAAAALDEAIDLLPANKLLAFGGDYGHPVEKVYGHLTMARENVARVLAARIERGFMNESDALELARRWFRQNALDLYRIDV